MCQTLPAVPEILGGPSDGTLAEYVIIPSQNANKTFLFILGRSRRFTFISFNCISCLVYKSPIEKSEYLLIPGIGSGVATYALFMAKAIGATLSVTSRNEEKRKRALQLGADYAIDSYSNWDEQLQGKKADVVLDSIGPALFSEYFRRHIKPNGRIVSFGASSGDDLRFPVRSLFFPQINVLGTSIGSCEEFRDMLAFIEKYKLRPVIDCTFPLEKACEAYTRMQEGRQFGNIGIVME